MPVCFPSVFTALCRFYHLYLVDFKEDVLCGRAIVSIRKDVALSKFHIFYQRLQIPFFQHQLVQKHHQLVLLHQLVKMGSVLTPDDLLGKVLFRHYY